MCDVTARVRNWASEVARYAREAANRREELRDNSRRIKSFFTSLPDRPARENEGKNTASGLVNAGQSRVSNTVKAVPARARERRKRAFVPPTQLSKRDPLPKLHTYGGKKAAPTTPPSPLPRHKRAERARVIRCNLSCIYRAPGHYGYSHSGGEKGKHRRRERKFAAVTRENPGST